MSTTKTSSEQLASLAQTIGSDVKHICANIGDLSSLTTDEKKSLVSALNELKEKLNSIDLTDVIDDTKTVTNLTWSSTQISKAIGAAVAALVNGAPETMDTLKELSDAIEANEGVIDTLETIASGHIKFDGTQNLTESEKAQARTNISAASSEDVSNLKVDVENLGAVKYSEVQSLTTEEQKQSLKNIGAVSYLDNTLSAAQAIQTLKNLRFDVSCAAFANSLWGGRNLLDGYSEKTINEKIADGDFSDLFVGDYIVKTITVDNQKYARKWRCAHFDYYLGVGNVNCTAHHVVMVPEGICGNTTMNATATSANGFYGSVMWKTTLPKFKEAIQASFGTEHVLAHKCLITSSMTNTLIAGGGSNWSGGVPIWGWMWVDCYVNLMTEYMVYGAPVYGNAADSSSYQTQLALFRLNSQMIHCRSSYWLSAVASNSTFSRVNTDGGADAHAATTLTGMRPFFFWC